MIGASRLNDVDIGKNDGGQWEIAEIFRKWNGTYFIPLDIVIPILVLFFAAPYRIVHSISSIFDSLYCMYAMHMKLIPPATKRKHSTD